MNYKQLKIFAVCCMVFDHVVRIFPLYWLFMPLSDALWAAGREAASDWVSNDLTLMLMFIGRMAAPVFVFGIAMGFTHTHDIKGYLRRLLVTAVIAQLPYTLFDLAELRRCYGITGSWQDTGLNILFTLALGLAALALFAHCRRHGTLWLGILTVIAAMLLGRLVPMEGGKGYVLLLFVFYLTRNLPRWQRALLFIPAVMLSRWGLMWWALTEQSAVAVQNCVLNVLGNYMGMLVTLIYNGEKGNARTSFQQLMYAFYPAHFAILALTGFLLPPL